MKSILLGVLFGLLYPKKTWEDFRSYIIRKAQIIQMIGFWSLAISKGIILIAQVYLILQGKTENLTMSVLLAGVSVPLLSARLFSRSHKRINEESTRSMAWLQKVTASIFATVSLLFMYERHSHGLPIWWEYDNITVQILVVEAIVIFLFLFCSRLTFVFKLIFIGNDDKRLAYSKNKNRWIQHPTREGILMGLIPIAVQIPLGLSFSKYGTHGLSIATIILGYIIPTVRMLMLLNTKNIEEQGKIDIRKTNQAKVGQIIGDCVFLSVWIWVTTQYIQHS